ncbi:MAG: SDR family oxidoreductase [Nitrospira sp.]|nr:SDR family oxidoreductase [Nitrospira sp.]
MKLEGATILITGGAKRVGRGIALALARQNARVAISYQTSSKAAEATVKEIQALGAKAVAVPADVSKAQDVDRLFKTVHKTLGSLDILINNAAVYEETPFDKITEKEWDRHLEINLKGSFLCARIASEVMQKQGRGKIINIADWSGIRPYKNYLPYCVSKAGVIALTKALALELAPTVQVNCICPGPILLPEFFGEKDRQEIIAQTPLARVGSPEDIAAAALFFIQGSDFVTGAILPVDGGRLIA